MKQLVKSCLNGLLSIVRLVMRIGQSIKSLLGLAPGWRGFQRWLLQIGALGTLAGAGGLLAAALGLVPIKASSGHWPITAWFLNFTMSRSVSTHAMGIQAPMLDDPGMIIKGATHYETGCFPCHGNPAIQHPRIARQMTPHPPYLPPVVHEWEPKELFYIVKHGVKFTGMPAWPSKQRDDEVWAMVAFLQKLPELDEMEYRSMVSGESLASRENAASGEYMPSGFDAPLQSLAGPTAGARSISYSCGRCHGMNGQGREAGVAPKLAGQQPAYLEASLDAFIRGDRHSGIMEPIATGLTRDERREVAQYFGQLAPSQVSPQSSKTSELAISRGATIALEGVTKARIPVCAQCHGPSANARNARYPTLAGQYADYLVLQLELFADKKRGGTEFAPLMHPVVDHMTNEQIRDVAMYYESLTSSIIQSKW